MRDAIAFGQGSGQIVFVAGFSQGLKRASRRVGHPAGMGLETLGLLDQEAREVPAMDLFGFEEGGHGVAAEERQVATEDQAVKAGEGPLDGVRVLGDELVHSGIAHELGREGNLLAPMALVRILDPERNPILPRDGLGEPRGPIGSLAAAPRISRLDPRTPPDIRSRSRPSTR